MNNTFPVGSDTAQSELTNGALASGSAQNLRWEITSANTSSGVFSLAIRRGDDTNNNNVLREVATKAIAMPALLSVAAIVYMQMFRQQYNKRNK